MLARSFVVTSLAGRFVVMIALCLLNFSKMMMYLNLDPARWPSGAGNITVHPVLSRFFTSQTHDHDAESTCSESELFRIDDLRQMS